MNQRLVVHNIGHLVTMDPQRRVLKDSYVVMEDGWIRTVGTGPAPKLEDASTMDAKGGICLPGMANTHHHMFQNMARAYTPISNLPLLPWLAGHMPLWQTFNPEDLYLATQVALAELMLSGCTISCDHHYVFPKGCSPELMDAGFHAGHDIGSRYVACRGSLNKEREAMPFWSLQTTDVILSDCQRLFEKFHDKEPGSMSQLALAPCTVFGCDKDIYVETAIMARKLGLRMHTHTGETVPENEVAMKDFGMRPIERLKEYGWDGDNVWMAHGIHFTDAEVEHIGKSRMGVAHCPCSNMRLGSGVCRVNDLRDAGATVSLGVDGSASNDSGHMLNEARAALFLTRVVHGAESMTVEKVLEMATLEGARNLGRGHDLGSIEPGKCGDLAIFPAEDIWSNGAENQLHGLLLCHPRNVDTLIIQGKIRVANGNIVGLDLPMLLEKHRKAARRLHQSVAKH